MAASPVHHGWFTSYEDMFGQMAEETNAETAGKRATKKRLRTLSNVARFDHNSSGDRSHHQRRQRRFYMYQDFFKKITSQCAEAQDEAIIRNSFASSSSSSPALSRQDEEEPILSRFSFVVTADQNKNKNVELTADSAGYASDLTEATAVLDEDEVDDDNHEDRAENDECNEILDTSIDKCLHLPTAASPIHNCQLQCAIVSFQKK